MSTKINLLPHYVKLKPIFKWIRNGAIALLLIVAGVLAAIYQSGKLRLAKIEADAEGIQATAAKATSEQAAADALIATAVPIQTTVNFMADASKTGAERAALLDLVRRYVYRRAVVSSLDVSDGQTVKLAATIELPDDYARFLLALRKGSTAEQGPLFNGLPVASGIPGFPDGRAAVQADAEGLTTVPIVIKFPLSVNATGTLKTPVQVPAEPGAAPAAAAGGAPGMDGAAGMPGASPMGGAPTTSTATTPAAAPKAAG